MYILHGQKGKQKTEWNKQGLIIYEEEAGFVTGLLPLFQTYRRKYGSFLFQHSTVMTVHFVWRVCVTVAFGMKHSITECQMWTVLEAGKTDLRDLQSSIIVSCYQTISIQRPFIVPVLSIQINWDKLDDELFPSILFHLSSNEKHSTISLLTLTSCAIYWRHAARGRSPPLA